MSQTHTSRVEYSGMPAYLWSSALKNHVWHKNWMRCPERPSQVWSQVLLSSPLNAEKATWIRRSMQLIYYCIFTRNTCLSTWINFSLDLARYTVYWIWHVTKIFWYVLCEVLVNEWAFQMKPNQNDDSEIPCATRKWCEEKKERVTKQKKMMQRNISDNVNVWQDKCQNNYVPILRLEVKINTTVEHSLRNIYIKSF